MERDSDSLSAGRSEGRGTESPESSEDRLEAIEGVVKWFDPRKGFGFIVGPEGQDIFAHFSVIHGEGFRVLKDGSAVLYDATKTDKGWKATRVSRIEQIVVTDTEAKRVGGYSRSPRRS